MEFDKSKVYTSVNADELKVGSKVYVADAISSIREMVENDSDKIDTIECIEAEDEEARFFDAYTHWHLAYLISEPEEKKLKVSDLKLGDIVRHKSGNLEYLVTGIDHEEDEVFFGDDWSDDENLGKYWEKVEK